MGKTGTIVSWTIIRVPSTDFTNQAPYPVAIVDLEGGKRITAQIVDLPAGRQAGNEDVKTGQKVITIIRKVFETGDGIIPYGIKVRPI